MSLEDGRYALVGGNGAGKSTLLKILVGSEDADSGQVIMGGHDMKSDHIEARRKFSYVPDKPLVYPFLTGEEFLRMIASMHHIKQDDDIDKLVQQFGLVPHVEKKFSEMSLGTQRKFFLVAALMAKPSILFMDEPTNGLDQDTLDNLVELLTNDDAPRLVLFSSHDQDFIKRLSATKLNLKKGQLLLE
ncbi:MAG: ABC transporter ATP-binding protein [Candidatus Marinimicrobia bacterium]|nr:ABC transporter ATP-binding protein [Candidatus Neomarinimicrobiota bacterium]